MGAKSPARLAALTDKWAALEKLGPSLWSGGRKKEKKKKTPSFPVTFFFIHRESERERERERENERERDREREEIKHCGFCIYGLFPKYENY